MKSKEELAAERAAVYRAIEAGATKHSAIMDATCLPHRRVDAACQALKRQGKIRQQWRRYPHREVVEEARENVLTLEAVDGGSFTARCSSCPEWNAEGGDYEEVLKASLRHWLDAHDEKSTTATWAAGKPEHATALSVEGGQVVARQVELPEECDHGAPWGDDCDQCRGIVE